jgi:23S rRNA pseudouridine1911/1915/1917 synthase
VEGRPNEQGECEDWLIKDERHRRVHIAAAGAAGAQQARLTYRRLASRQGESLLEVRLLTGRKHQIRLQLARLGHPVIGDRKYGSRQPFPRGIALHARRLAVDHPIRHEALELVAPLPDYWPRVTGNS